MVESSQSITEISDALPRVLVVDDTRANLLSFEAILASPQYELVCASSGLEALGALGAKAFAVVVLDVLMPVMDGIETALKIRQLPEPQRSVPIVFVTAADLERVHVLRAYAAGAVDFVTKPVEPAVLRAKVSAFVELHSTKQSLASERREARRKFDENEARICAFSELALALSQARSSERRGHERREFLARAGASLGSSLDYRTALRAVARLAIPELADWCTVHVLEPGSDIPQQLEVAHVDPQKVEFALDLGRRYPPDPSAPYGVGEVVRTGRSELYPEIPEALLRSRARDDDHLRLLNELRLGSALIVPLRTRDRVFGAMSFVYAESGRRYAHDDLEFAEDFARRAAMAIENAHALQEADAARAREQSLRADAEFVSRAKDEFLAMVSHELRTPLHAILGWTVILRNRHPDAATDHGLSIIEQSARTQARLVEDVLDVSRIVSGKLALNVGPTNVTEALAAAVETIGPAAMAKQIRLVVETVDDGLVITADPDRIQQVVWNLLSNAVKFTPNGGSVLVRTYREGSDVCIWVTDSGEGIAPGVLPYVFEPFLQGDASTTRRHGGLGLGLAIVRQVVSAHGGSVHAQSGGTSKGATFVVRLPAPQLSPSVVRTSRGTSPGDAAFGAAKREPPRLDGLRLLVIDDEEDARDLLREILSERGAEVQLAASADDALSMMEHQRHDMIVCDIGMPGADGYTLMRRIRELRPARGGRTPAVALTAYARVEDAERAFAAGFQRHVTKPVDPARLVSIVADLAGRSLAVSRF